MRGMSGAIIVAIAIGALVGAGWLRRHELVERRGRRRWRGRRRRRGLGRRRRRGLGRSGRFGRFGRRWRRTRSRPVPRLRRRRGDLQRRADLLLRGLRRQRPEGRELRVNGAWSVETGPCTGVVCQSQYSPAPARFA